MLVDPDELHVLCSPALCPALGLRPRTALVIYHRHRHNATAIVTINQGGGGDIHHITAYHSLYERCTHVSSEID